MTKMVFPLSDMCAKDASLSGSKGASLARMTQTDIPVPPGFIVSTRIFQSSDEGIAEALVGLKSLSNSDSSTLEGACEQVRKAILNTPLPEHAVEKITEAFGSMGSLPVSVRSSSTAEDLAQVSFAGQYDTFLNVCSLENVIHSLKRVWASLYSLHAFEYRRRNKIPEEQVAMAAIVQEQLAPVSSGVLFTRNPISGENHFVISATLGLGEGVVSGSTNTDRFVLKPETGELISSTVAEKPTRFIAVESGGISSAPVPPEESNIPALATEQLTNLTVLGRQLAELFGCPQDIEFAFTEEAVHILQSRPLTAISEDVEPDEPWDASGSTSFTWRLCSGGPLYRLQQDYEAERRKQMGVCFEKTGFEMTANHIIHTVNGYMYARKQEVNEDTLTKRHDAQRERVDAFYDKGVSYFEGAIRPLLEDRLKTLKVHRKSAINFLDHVDYLYACLQTCGYVQGNLHWSMVRPGPRPDWQTEYLEITGDEAQNAAIYLYAIRNRMTRLIARLRELARIVQSDPVLSEIFSDRQYEALSNPEIKAKATVKLFNFRFKQMLKVYGLRSGHGYGSSSGFATPTWNMNQTIPLEIIASYAEQDLDALDQLEHKARNERINATRRTRRKLAAEPEKLERFNRSLMVATLTVRFMEDHNYYMEQCTVGTMREAIFEVGKLMVRKDLIDSPDDIFHFSLDELRTIAQEKKPCDQRDFVKERMNEWERRKRMRPPQWLGAQPEDPAEKDEGGEFGREENAIKGVSASRGHVTGRAVIVTVGMDRPRLRPGDILVAKNVGPEWTPVFGVIGGLVLDQGDLSQHAAIVAREYLVPAVMKTKEATIAISSGQRITVDGDNGVVELH